MRRDKDLSVRFDAVTIAGWISRNAHALTTIDPQAPLDDMAPLRDMVADASIVAIGASTRFAHELSVLAHRTLRFLVEEMGFRSLVLEEDWAKCLQLDLYLRTGQGDPHTLLADIWRPHRTGEILAAIRWMRSYNQAHPFDPVRIAGADDTRLTAPAYDAVLGYARRTVPDRVDELQSLYADLRPSSGASEHDRWVRDSADRQAFVHRAREAFRIVEAGADGGPDAAMALQHARTIVSYYEYQENGELAHAERRHAGNTIWWRERTGHRIVYWGGSGHTANARARNFSPPPEPSPERNAGSYLREHCGRKYLSVALTFDRGSLPFDVPSPPRHFADAVLGDVGLQTYCLNLRARHPPAVRQWLDMPARVRLIGPVFDANHNADYYMSGGSLGEWFDVIMHHQEVSPTQALQEQPV